MLFETILAIGDFDLRLGMLKDDPTGVMIASFAVIPFSFNWIRCNPKLLNSLHQTIVGDAFDVKIHQCRYLIAIRYPHFPLHLSQQHTLA